MKLYLYILVVIISYAPISWSEEVDEASFYVANSVELKELATEFAQCSGVFQAYSEYLEPTHPATSENIKGLKRGAEFSAMFLFTKIKIAKDNVLRKYGEAMPQVENIAYGPYNQILSLIELGNAESLKIELQKCLDLNETQADIVKMMRDEIY